MNRFSQNLLYLGVLLVVFAICAVLFYTNEPIKPHGVFLPAHDIRLPSIDPDNVKAFDLKYSQNKLYKGEFDNAIGSIRASINVKNPQDFERACNKDLEEAVRLAAANGTNTVRYMCFFPEGQLNELSTVNLQAYAFRD
ncbi:Francisella virulence factor A [Francisella frigiditurris]|uniref:Uncharacterized protein n=1 Tax=Francisella frigiditurris TaxID=1542390 RepID=A0A1J0KR79_9GAMM|nr:hypothetical protein [Francisella frigiditurris]APC96253.1 hypothetical protein KX01_1203 [Francisella frigiditurris]